jgi:hypothetical protein
MRRCVMPKPIEVELEWYELYQAGKVGWHRHVEAIRRKLRNKKRGEKPSYVAHIEGCLGEVAVAKATNRYWSGSVNVGKRVPDVGSHIEVRCRDETAGQRDLIVRSDDPDDRVMVLVTWDEDSLPALRVEGWIEVKKAKRKEYEKNPMGYGVAYFVPKDKLKDIRRLPHVKNA